MNIIILFLPRSPIGVCIANNLYWIIPSLLSLGAIITLAISTKKQIDSSKNSIEQQINSSNLSTQKQIENQNKESHRPYLILKSPSKIDIDRDDVDFCIEIKHKNNNRNKHSHFEEITFENAGYGIAKDIKLIPITKDVLITEKNSSSSDKRLVLPILDIKHGYEDKVLLELNLDDNHNRFPIAVVYRDLNQNTYISTMLIGDWLNGKLTYTFTPEGSVRFRNHSKLTELNVEDVIERYENYYNK